MAPLLADVIAGIDRCEHRRDRLRRRAGSVHRAPGRDRDRRWPSAWRGTCPCTASARSMPSPPQRWTAEPVGRRPVRRARRPAQGGLLGPYSGDGDARRGAAGGGAARRSTGSCGRERGPATALSVHAERVRRLLAAADDESRAPATRTRPGSGGGRRRSWPPARPSRWRRPLLDAHGDDSGATAHALTGADAAAAAAAVPATSRCRGGPRMSADAGRRCGGGTCRRCTPSRRSSSPTDPWSSEQFWQELAQPTRTYLVCVEGDEVVGYAGHVRDAAGRRHPDGGRPRRSAGTRHRPAAAGRACSTRRRGAARRTPCWRCAPTTRRRSACTSRSASSGSASAAATTPTAAMR